MVHDFYPAMNEWIYDFDQAEVIGQALASCFFYLFPRTFSWHSPSIIFISSVATISRRSPAGALSRSHNCEEGQTWVWVRLGLDYLSAPSLLYCALLSLPQRQAHIKIFFLWNATLDKLGLGVLPFCAVPLLLCEFWSGERNLCGRKFYSPSSFIAIIWRRMEWIWALVVVWSEFGVVGCWSRKADVMSFFLKCFLQTSVQPTRVFPLGHFLWPHLFTVNYVNILDMQRMGKWESIMGKNFVSRNF